jgi:O-succinylbenzoic acid--CoA ligase
MSTSDPSTSAGPINLGEATQPMSVPPLRIPPLDGPVPVGHAVERLRLALTRALDGTGPALEMTTQADPDGAPSDGGPSDGAPHDETVSPSYDSLPDDTALIVHTSGSTGVPKKVVLSRSALLASATATADRLDGPGHWLLALSTHHIAGLQVVIRSLLAGTDPTTLETDAPFTGESFVEAVSRMPAGAPRYTSLVPTQIRRLVDSGDAGALTAASSFQAILVGGAALPDSLARQAYEAGLNLVTTYGMSETCGGCVYDGVPLSSARIRTDDDGRVQIGGAVLASGYLEQGGNADRDGRLELGSHLELGDHYPGSLTSLGTDRLDQQGFSTDPDGSRWFTTSDLGQVWDGQLEIFGRADDVIISGGRNVSPQAVEACLVALPGIAEALVVGVDDREWGQRVVALLVREAEVPLPDLEEIRAAVKERLDSASAPTQAFVVDELPLRSLGKPDRRAATALAAELEAGDSGRYGRVP